MQAIECDGDDDARDVAAELDGDVSKMGHERKE